MTRARFRAAPERAMPKGSPAARRGPKPEAASRCSREPPKAREVRAPSLEERLLPLLRLLGHVIKKRGVTGELLHTGLSVELRVERGFEQAQRERRRREHL